MCPPLVQIGLSNFFEILDIYWIFVDEMKVLTLKSHLNMYLP